MTRPERRSSDRVPFVSDLHYSIEDVGFDRRSSDLSCTGIYVDDSWPPENGKRVLVEFDLEGRQIKTFGRVVASETPMGFAVAFEDSKPEDLEAIASFVAHAP